MTAIVCMQVSPCLPAEAGEPWPCTAPGVGWGREAPCNFLDQGGEGGCCQVPRATGSPCLNVEPGSHMGAPGPSREMAPALVLGLHRGRHWLG